MERMDKGGSDSRNPCLIFQILIRNWKPGVVEVSGSVFLVLIDQDPTFQDQGNEGQSYGGLCCCKR